MMRSLYSGVSGLKAHQTKMDVIGNNIANVNTVAYKANSVRFSDILYQTTSGASSANALTGVGGKNAKQIGLGTTTASITSDIKTAGSTQTTGGAFDLKITGDSFFVVSNGNERFFTKAGAFDLDSTGNLVMASTGFNVMGWKVDATDPTTIHKDTVTALQVTSAENLISDPEATTKAMMSGLIDKNDVDVVKESGKVLNLDFYDALGYKYTAKFSLKYAHSEGLYTIDLTDILDGNGQSVSNAYPTKELASYFGEGYSYNYTEIKEVTTTNTLTVVGGTLAQSGTANGYYIKTINDIDYAYDNLGNFYKAVVKDDGGYDLGSAVKASVVLNEMNYVDTANKKYELTVDQDTGNLLIEEEVTSEESNIVTVSNTVGGALVHYNPDTGYFEYIGSQGNKSMSITLSALDGKFEDIEIDFSATKTFDNDGDSTVAMDSGDAQNIGAGRKMGNMTGVSVDTNGMIYGTYDNGTNRLLGQIAVATFPNPGGLQKVGDNLYQTTLNSGEFDGIGQDITADGGMMTSGVLEMSNVDLSTELTEMIITQRGFQANSRIITTSDTLLEELINLKR